MSKITNDGLTQSGTGCLIAVPLWQQWASKGQSTGTGINSLSVEMLSREYDVMTDDALLCLCVVCVEKKTENSSKLNIRDVATPAKADEVEAASHSSNKIQPTSSDKPLDQCGKRELCQWVMAKANSLNEVNRPTIDAAAFARISLDAESCPTANRRRRKRHNTAQQVCTIISSIHCVSNSSNTSTYLKCINICI